MRTLGVVLTVSLLAASIQAAPRRARHHGPPPPRPAPHRPLPATAPKPGALESYMDWTIGCDNAGRCEAIALWPSDTQAPDEFVLLGITRDAGPDADAQVWVETQDARDPADLSLHVDGRKIASAPSVEGNALVTGPAASALAIAIARGTTIEVRRGDQVVARPSLGGASAALRYMDTKQGRAGTVTALVATGPLGKDAVKPRPPVPIVQRVAVPPGPNPVALTRAELTRLAMVTGCTTELRGGEAPELHRLSRWQTLIFVPCGGGAYNFTSVPMIATGVPGRRLFTKALFDYQPGWSEDAAHPMLVNAGWVPEQVRLSSYAKGRGVGDCGGSEAYAWDGTRFRLIEATAMAECRGAWRWIQTWQAKVVE